MKSVDTRGAVASMVDYLAAVDNTVEDSDDLESMKTMIKARTEKLLMDLNNSGISVQRHIRNLPLENRRVDVIEKTTESKDLDLKVVRSKNYGAMFRNNVYPMIPETVIVYRSINKEPEDGQNEE